VVVERRGGGAVAAARCGASGAGATGERAGRVYYGRRAEQGGELRRCGVAMVVASCCGSSSWALAPVAERNRARGMLARGENESKQAAERYEELAGGGWVGSRGMELGGSGMARGR
jgi:hypothetical protein